MRLLPLPLAVIAALIVLVACSKSDTQTLSCYGTLLSSIGDNNESVVSNARRSYKLNGSEFIDYECTKNEDVISCNSVLDKGGTRELKRIIYDTKSLFFSESHIIWDLAKINSPTHNLISKSEFIGTCQKPVFN